MRFEATLDLHLQLFIADLKRVHLSPAERKQKTRPIQSGDFGAFALRDHATVIPENRGREPELARELFVRFSERQRRVERRECNIPDGVDRNLIGCYAVGAILSRSGRCLFQHISRRPQWFMEQLGEVILSTSAKASQP